MSKIRVAVVMGGRSAEREVSLSSGRQVLAALSPDRYEAWAADPAWIGLDAEAAGSLSPAAARFREILIGRERPDVAFLCLHGRFGEDGTIQGLLELLDIPYTGSGVLASALAMDKARAKQVLELHGIRTPGSLTLHGREAAHAFLAGDAGWAGVGLPYVVKPNRQGSTIGMSVVRDPSEAAAALDTAFAYDDCVLVESFIEGIEITGPVLGNDDPRCLPLVEIVPHSGFYDYEAKYTPGATDEIVPAQLPEDVAAEARDIAVRCHRALGCRGVSRTDMMVRGSEIRVLEVNTIPGMTPTSLLPRSAEAAGLSFSDLVDALVDFALEGRDCESVTVRP